jgi:hypothetical protein
MRLFLAALLLASAASAQTRVDELLPLPAEVDPAALRQTSLCIFPFVNDAGRGDARSLDGIQKIFFDVARDSSLLRDAVLLPAATSRCAIRDAACFAAAGKAARCENVLVGASAAKGNGAVLSVRIFEVARQRILPGSEVEQVLEADRPGDVEAWAEGQACRGLHVHCAGKILVDVDRRDMTVYVDGRRFARTFASPETLTVEPGVHAVRVASGQRTSLEKKVSVRRGGSSEVVYARQTDKGGLPVWLASELHGGRPDPSVEFRQGGWTRPTGLTIAAAGLLAAGIGAYEGVHSRNLMNGVNARYQSQQAYLRSDVATLDSARSAAHTANLLYATSAVLAAAGLGLAFAF